MRVIATLFFAVLLSASTFASISLSNPQKVRSVADVKLDTCSFCVSFVSDSIDELLQAILNGGVLGGCSGLCSYLSNTIEAGACNLICDYVGIEAFVEALNDTDPDPIYVCQAVDFCAEVDGGTVVMNNASVSPSSGPTGSTFNIIMGYTVTNPIGPGYLVVELNCPDGNVLSGESFNDQQPDGNYQVEWQVTAEASEQESFGPGVYQVIVAVCEGDCTNSHPYGGVYATGQTQFTITG